MERKYKPGSILDLYYKNKEAETKSKRERPREIVQEMKTPYTDTPYGDLSNRRPAPVRQVEQPIEPTREPIATSERQFERPVKTAQDLKSFSIDMARRTPSDRMAQSVPDLGLQEPRAGGISTPETIVEPYGERIPETMRQAEPETLWQKAKGVMAYPFTKSNEEQKDYDIDIAVRAKTIRDEREEASGMPQEERRGALPTDEDREIATKQRHQEKAKEFEEKATILMAMGGVGALGAGATTVLSLARGLAIFSATDMAKTEIIKQATNGEKESLADFLGDSTNESTLQLARVLELIAEGGVATVAEKKALAPVISALRSKIMKPGTKMKVLKNLLPTSEKDKLVAESLKVLGLKEGASTGQINKRVKHGRTLHHPDRFVKSEKYTQDYQKDAHDKYVLAEQVLKEFYKSGARVSKPTKTTKVIMDQTSDLKKLGLKWGVERYTVESKYKELSGKETLTKDQKAAYDRLMVGEKKYNPWKEKDAWDKESRKNYEELSLEELKTRDASGEITASTKTRALELTQPAKNKAAATQRRIESGIKPALTTGISARPEIPVTGTKQAEFTIVDPKKAVQLKKLRTRLETARAKRQEVIDSGRGGAEVKKSASSLAKTIEKIDNQIATAETQAISMEGPVRKTAPVQKTSTKTTIVTEVAKSKPTIKESIAKTKTASREKEIVKALKPKKEPKVYKRKITEPKLTEARSYKEIKERAEKKVVKKQTSAIDRVLGGRKRTDVAKAARADRKPVDVVIERAAPKKLKPELVKMKRNGKDIGDFAEMSRKAYSDFLAGKTKTDKSKAIDDFIESAFTETTDRYYARKTAQAKPETRKLKTPSKIGLGGKIKSLVTRKKDFKLYKETEKVIREAGNLISQKRIGRGAEGVYKPKSKIVGVKSLNNPYVVTHEVAHSLDIGLGIIDSVKSKKDFSMVSGLQDIFNRYYPGNPKLTKTEMLHEGFATLMERFILAPKQTAEEFPLLVEQFLTPNGRYYTPEVGKFLAKLNKVVSEFLSMDEMAQEVSTIVFNQGKMPKNSILNLRDKVIRTQVKYEVVLDKLGDINNLGYSTDSPGIAFKSISAAARTGLNNLTGNKGYHSIDGEGSLVKVADYNWKTLGRKLGKMGLYKEFSPFLYNRRFVEIGKKIEKLEKSTSPTEKDLADLDRYKKQVERSKIDLDKANRIVNSYEDDFFGVAEKFDKLAFAPVESAYKTGLISKDFYTEMKETKGYANVSRSIVDDIEGQDGAIFSRVNTVGGKPGALGEFKGSDRDVKDLFISTAKSQIYLNEKIMLQKTLQNLYKLEDYGGQIDVLSANKIKEEQTSFFPKINGDTVSFRSGNEWVEMRLSKDILRVFDVQKKLREHDAVRNAARGFARLFTTGTTGVAWPAFALVNLSLDFLVAAAQTRNKAIPVLDGARYMMGAVTKKATNLKKYASPKVISDKHKKTVDMLTEKIGATKMAEYWDEYTIGGGLDFALVGSFEKDALKIANELSTLERMTGKTKKVGEGILKVLGSAPKISEALTRFGEYVRARQNGHKHITALQFAKEATANFESRGEMWGQTGRNLDEASSYANSMKQVIYAGFRGQFSKETWKRYTTMGLIAGGVSLAGLMYMKEEEKKAIASGDQERIDNITAVINDYKNQNQYGLDNHMYTVTEDGKGLRKVRVAGAQNLAGALVNRAVAEVLFDKESSMSDYLTTIKDVYVPNRYDITNWKEAVVGWVPQIIKAEVEIAMNSKTFPNVKDIETVGMSRLPTEDRYYPWTDDFAVHLGQTSAMKTAGVSPLQIEHWIKGKFGRGGAAWTQYSDEGLFSGFAKAQVDGFSKIIKNKTYMFSGDVYNKFKENSEETAKKYTMARRGTDDRVTRELKKENDLYKAIRKRIDIVREINSKEDKTIPAGMSNKIFDLVEMMTKKDVPIEELEKKYRSEIGDIDNFIRRNR